MRADKILVSGLIATSFMTLFSYLVSAYKRENFKEPELLGGLEKDALPAVAKELSLPAGWATHFSIGIVWAALYEYLWQNLNVKPTVKTALVLGGFSGLTGILIWWLAFRIHPRAPRTQYRKFFGHLLLAHFVYSISATMCGRYNNKDVKLLS